MVIKLSREVLSHFQCGSCGKWWTVGDAPEERQEWFCPWCGEEQRINFEKKNLK